MMTLCDRERSVLDAVLNGRWPGGCPEELQMHVEGCTSCSDVAQVALAFQADSGARSRDARLPSSGQVWWRAAIRARLESSRTAARPVTWAQAGAGACAAGAAAAMITSAWPSIQDLAGRAAGRAAGLDARSAEFAGLMIDGITRSLPLVLTVAAAIILMPLLVLYYALSDE